jgi:hypothetical protein
VRTVDSEPVDDGMSWLHLYSDTATVEAARRLLRANAVKLRSQDGEKRTRAQPEADIAGDLLTGNGTRYAAKVRLGAMIPVTALTDNAQLLQHDLSSHRRATRTSRQKVPNVLGTRMQPASGRV